MERVPGITKALADESRLRILLAVETPLCLGQITEVLGLAASTVSKHLHILQGAGLVQGWAEGRWHYFARVRDSVPTHIQDILAWVTGLAGGSEQARADASRRGTALDWAPRPEAVPCPPVGGRQGRPRSMEPDAPKPPADP